MKNNQPIVIELVTSIEIVCRQINTMTELTGRVFSKPQIQIMIDKRVEEFKLLYSEIPKNAKFTIENNEGGMLFISSNDEFREYVDEIENQAASIIEPPIVINDVNNTLH